MYLKNQGMVTTQKPLKLVILIRTRMSITTQGSKSGDNSTTIQAGTINVNNGLTYGDVKEIALDVFKANFIQVSKEALQIANQRIEEFANSFISKLESINPILLESIKSP